MKSSVYIVMVSIGEDDRTILSVHRSIKGARERVSIYIQASGVVWLESEDNYWQNDTSVAYIVTEDLKD